MNMPGFTAEASLYKTSDSYQATAFFAQNQGAINPAQLEREPTVRQFEICISRCYRLFGRLYCYQDCQTILA